MTEWHNWSGKLTAQPTEIHFLRSEMDAQALAYQADQQGRCIRVAGATHSHSPLVVATDILVESQGLSGVTEVDPDASVAWIRAGSRIYTLGRALQTHGLALSNQGDIDEQALAGATGTGTHGTGASLQNLSASVVGIELALASGELVRASADNDPDLWRTARLHLGAFGIVTQVAMALRPAYRLQEHSWQAPLAEILSELDTLTAENRHFEFFWYPQGDRAQAKTLNETALAAEYPLATEGTRCAWSYEVLPNHRPHKHTEMEYSVPAEHGPACMQALANLLKNDFPDVRWPVEYRTLAADDVWLSTAFERDTVTLSVHQDVNLDESAYYRACEEVFLHYEGRPHWGKINYLDGLSLAASHPRWAEWWTVRDRVDPNGTFLNPYLKSIRPT